MYFNHLICILLFLSACSGGGSNSSFDETSSNIAPPVFSYSPPSGTSRDNCVSRSSSTDWHEDFNVSQLNLSTWSYDEGCNDNGGGCNGNNEYQNYKSNDLDNLFIEDGLLKIQPIFETNTGSDNVTQSYSSAKIFTKDKLAFSFGSRLTVCFKVPEGTGLWPAIWMLPFDNSPWPSGGEIDLMEARGRSYTVDGSPGQDNIIGSAVHFGTQWPDNKYIAANFYSSIENTYQKYFHSITLIFLENEISFYVNNETSPHLKITPDIFPLNQYTYPFNRNYYLILNVAVGGNFDGGRVEPTEICNNAECSNFENPDDKRLLIDWIEYERLN